MTRVFVSARSRRRTLALFAVAVAAFGVVAYLSTRFVPELTDPQAAREFVGEFGPFGPLVFLLVQATQVVVAPIPGAALGFVSGYLFGTVAGTAYSVAGATLGSLVAFGLSRRYGRPYVERHVDERVRRQFDALVDEHGLFGLFLVFLVPGLPDDAICFVAGCTWLSIRRMVLVSLVGRLPGYFLVNLAGDSTARYNYGETALVLGGLAVLSLFFYVNRAALAALLGVDVDGGEPGHEAGVTDADSRRREE